MNTSNETVLSQQAQMNQRDGKTRVDYAVGGVILMWELAEMTKEEAQARITILLADYLSHVRDINDTYYKRAVNEASLRGFHILEPNTNTYTI